MNSVGDKPTTGIYCQNPPNEYIIFVVSPVFTPAVLSPGFTGVLVSAVLPGLAILLSVRTET